MSNMIVIWLLRLLHIMSGVFWVGGVLFLARFLFPTSTALGAAAGPVMDHLMRVQQVPRALAGAGFVSVLSGLGLYWHDSMGFQAAWIMLPTGLVFGAGGIFAVVALLIGITINRPTANKLASVTAAIHASGGSPSPDQVAMLRALQARLGSALRGIAVLLVLATAAMALARYI